MIPYSKINKGHKYILTCIDVFSRFARAVPVKNKNSKDMSNAMKTILKDSQPKHIQTDLGKEFYNSSVKAILNKYNINHYSVFSQYKAALVERFNRTLRSKLAKYFIYRGNKVWIHVLQKLIHSYNYSPHRGLNGNPPIDVTDDLYFCLQNEIKTKKKPKYRIGDFVRISKIGQTPFIKNFDQNWSDEVFRITGINTKQMPVMYEISDVDDQVIRGKFYEQELQVLPREPIMYRIEKIIRKKGNQVLVKWHGYSKPSWINASNINKTD